MLQCIGAIGAPQPSDSLRRMGGWRLSSTARELAAPAVDRRWWYHYQVTRIHVALLEPWTSGRSVLSRNFDLPTLRFTVARGRQRLGPWTELGAYGWASRRDLDQAPRAADRQLNIHAALTSQRLATAFCLGRSPLALQIKTGKSILLRYQGQKTSKYGTHLIPGGHRQPAGGSTPLRPFVARCPGALPGIARRHRQQQQAWWTGQVGNVFLWRPVRAILQVPFVATRSGEQGDKSPDLIMHVRSGVSPAYRAVVPVPVTLEAGFACRAEVLHWSPHAHVARHYLAIRH